MPAARKAHAFGFHHVALSVGDVDEAVRFYGRLFHFEIVEKSESSAFLDLIGQFLVLQKGRTQDEDGGRNVGLVVDDRQAVQQALAEAGIKPLPGPLFRFRDPWGNRVEIVCYE